MSYGTGIALLSHAVYSNSEGYNELYVCDPTGVRGTYLLQV